MQAVVVSYVPFGYGAPQIGFLASSLASAFGMQVTVLHYRDLSVEATAQIEHEFAVKTFFSLHNPYSFPGVMEYLHFAAEQLNEWRPDLVVITNPLHLMLLRLLQWRPKAMIYYALELMHEYKIDLRGVFDPAQIDLVIQPEINRALRDSRALGLNETPTIVLWNAVRSFNGEPPKVKQRRIVYAGTLDPVTSLAADYLDPRVSRYPIDIYGRAWSGPGGDLIHMLPTKPDRGVTFRGYRLNDPEFEALLSTYSFSIVRWTETLPDTYFCCPNKLFQALGAGVPIIATPNPLCQEVIRRYDVGIITENWSIEAFIAALEKACGLLGTKSHQGMINRAIEAHHTELNWDIMFRRKAYRAILRLLDPSRDSDDSYRASLSSQHAEFERA